MASRDDEQPKKEKPQPKPEQTPEVDLSGVVIMPPNDSDWMARAWVGKRRQKPKQDPQKGESPDS